MPNKVFLHNLTLKGIENVFGILNYDQRAIILLNKYDCIITRQPIEPLFIEYLKHLGFDFEGVKFYVSNSALETFESIFYEPELVEFLKDKHGYELSTYNLTDIEDSFAIANKLLFLGNYRVAERYGRKSFFREICIKLNLPVVYGFEKLSRMDQILESISKIQSKNILLRLDEGVSGAGNFLFNKIEFNVKTLSQKELIINDILKALPQRLKNSGLTVETWMDDVVDSPSLQLYVHLNGEIELLSTHDQILEGKEKWFVGSQYPSKHSEYIHKNVLIKANKFGKYLHSQGFVGEFGLDIIITSDTYYFVEANIRTLGTSYPREFVKRVRGNLSNILYIAKDVEILDYENISFKDIAKVLESLKYNSQSDSGILIYNTATIPLRGRFDIVVVGKNNEELISYLNKAKKLLSESPKVKNF